MQWSSNHNFLHISLKKISILNSYSNSIKQNNWISDKSLFVSHVQQYKHSNKSLVNQHKVPTNIKLMRWTIINYTIAEYIEFNLKPMQPIWIPKWQKKKSTTKAIEQKANPTELIHQSGSALQINMTNNHQMSITPKSATQIKITNNYQMGIHPKPNSAKSFNKTIRFSYTNHNKTQNWTQWINRENNKIQLHKSTWQKNPQMGITKQANWNQDL